MSATGHFQLFPPAPPPPKTNRDATNPFRKGGTKGLSVVSTATSTYSTDGKSVTPTTQKSSPADAVLIQIYKEDSPVQDEVKALPTPPSEPTPVKEIKNEAFSFPKRTVSLSKRTPPPPIQVFKTKSPTVSAPEGESSGNGGSDEIISPVVPMRSMFPRYNPNLPLAKQPYYPQRAASPQDLPARAVSRTDYSPTRADVSTIDELVGGPKTAPASVMDFPLDALDVRMPRISTNQELEALWDATSGLGPDVADDSFNLKLFRSEEARFAFGSNPSFPFYTLDTFSNNELSICRRHPSKPNRNFEILQLTLQPPTRKAPSINSSSNLLERGSRDLITYVFPKLAAMVAIDQADSLTNEHHLAPTMALQTRQEALARAAAQEASKLYWNEREKRYELEHPAIGKDHPQAALSTSEVDTQSPSSRPVLHINVTSPEMSSPSSGSAGNPDTFPYTTISIIDPNRSNSPLPMPQRPASPLPHRASTLPLPDSDDIIVPASLASLIFYPTGPILTIDAPSILTLLPSLYAIDSLVSCLLAVAVADTLTNNLIADLPLYDLLAEHKLNLPPEPIFPRPNYAGSVMSEGAQTMGGRSYAGSTFYATVAEREDAERASQLGGSKHKRRKSSLPGGLLSTRSFAAMTAMKEDLEKDDESCDSDDDERATTTPSPAQNHKGWFGRRTRRKPRRKTKKITIQEFDLEKYGRYQSGSREGQKLPSPTRMALRVVFTLLQFIIWILTLFVGVLAKVMVGVTRGVTSERF